MSGSLNALVWWVGACVLGGVGAVGVAGIFAGCFVVAAAIADHYAKRFGNLNITLGLLREWVRSGRPVFRDGHWVCLGLLEQAGGRVDE